jgi:type I restriction enzyme S subunit
MLPPGSVLFSSRAPIGLVAIAGIPVCTNQGFKSFIPGPDVDKGYLFWCLRREAPRIANRGSGSTFAEVSKEVVSRFEIPLPPLAEQRRIAAVLDRADGIRRKRRESLRLLDEFLRSAFLEMFGDPVRNDRGWKQRRAGEVIEKIEAGTSVNGEEKVPGPHDWAVLKISAVTSGWYLPTECKVVEVPPEKTITPRVGDLLFSRANTRDLVAATCIVDCDRPQLFLPDKLWRLTPNVDRATPEYLRYLLANARFRRTLTRRATGTSGSMLNVSQEKLLELVLPLPSLDLQRRFASLVWRVLEMRQRLQKVSHETTVLYDSLENQAFAEDPIR